jgi:hypothetical protein
VIQFFKTLKKENKYVKKWFADVHLRMNVSLYGSLIWNDAFALFQLGLGFYHKSFWFYSMSAYYVMLGIMRFFLVKHTRKYKANEEITIEVKKSILCGYLLIAMNLALAVIVFFMVYWNKTFYHHMITTIALAAYTFFTFTFAIINLVKYRKLGSPVMSMTKIINMAAALVSMLSLETAMFSEFGKDMSTENKQIFIMLTGAGVSIIIVAMSVYSIVKNSKEIKQIMENDTYGE